MSISCLLVDDEHVALEGLQYMCSKYEQLKVVGTCRNGVEAIDSIRKLQPDLVLLDIQMPKINGIEVLSALEEPLPQVIFVTAYDEFAIKAFELNAVDYLLKPFTDDRFDQAIKRAIQQVFSRNNADWRPLINTHERSVGQNQEIRDQDKDRLVIKVDGKIHLIPKAEVIYFEAYDYYVKIHTSERYYLVRETMKHLEDQLASDQFLRTHKSYLVNRNYIRTMTRIETGNYVLELAGEHRAKVSRTKVGDVRAWLV